jgi:hypothetical protein
VKALLKALLEALLKTLLLFGSTLAALPRALVAALAAAGHMTCIAIITSFFCSSVAVSTARRTYH